LAGAITVGLLYLLVKRAVGSTGAAGGAAFLLAIDYLHFVHSRMAMLEAFVGLFAVGAFYFCLLDRAQLQARARGLPSHRRWRLAAGAAGGAAAACRLSGAFVVVGVIILVVAWEVAANRSSGRGRTAFGTEATSIVLMLVAAPLAVYMVTYAGRLHGSLLAFPWADGAWLREWVERQSYMVRFHGDKTAASTPSWALPMTERPLVYVLERSAGKIREVLLFGNPLLWWAGFGAVVYAAVCLLRRRRPGTNALVVVGFVASYATWLLVSLTRRDVFLFYAVPVAPFLYLALACAYSDFAGFRAVRYAATAVVLSAALAFAFYFPILAGRPLQPPDWRRRACTAHAIWLERIDHCGLTARTTGQQDPPSSATVAEVLQSANP
jgi:dolichyl-phosphate-mannose--protein O-mannosyl transferase